jgi:hypothetical protein
VTTASAPVSPFPGSVGSCVRQWQTMQAEAAQQDEFVVYTHEWHQGGQLLGPAGTEHLNRVARRMQENNRPVVIQREQDQQINEVRKTAVVAYLTRAGVADAAGRVVLGQPLAEGMGVDPAAGLTPRVVQPVSGTVLPPPASPSAAHDQARARPSAAQAMPALGGDRRPGLGLGSLGTGPR